MANDRIINEVTATAEIMGQQMTGPAIAVMVSDLEGKTESSVLHALQRVRRECQRLTLAAIFERLPGGWVGADEAWARFPRDEDDSAVVTQEAMIAWGVASELMPDAIAARMAFRDAYNRVVGEARARGEMPKPMLTLGHDRSRRSDAVVAALQLGAISRDRAMQLAYMSPDPTLLIERIENTELAFTGEKNGIPSARLDARVPARPRNNL